LKNTVEYFDEWTGLYENLILRHNINGISIFSHSIFAGMFKTPGLLLYRAFLNNETVGMVLFYEVNNVVYYHLGAYGDRGYENNASFGIFFQAINDFSTAGKKWLNLGGGAGLTPKKDDGLSRFKKGWSSETRNAWFCGKVLNKKVYKELCVNLYPNINFFPAYRTEIKVDEKNDSFNFDNPKKVIQELECAI